jgi:hypothetical protein
LAPILLPSNQNSRNLQEPKNKNPMSCTTPSRVRLPRKLENKKNLLSEKRGGSGASVGGMLRVLNREKKKVDARLSEETRAESQDTKRKLKKPQPK